MNHQNEYSSPGRHRHPLSLGAALAAALAAFGSGCKQEAPAPPPPPVVQVLSVTTTNVPLTAEFIGQLDSPQNVEVRARVEAFVDSVLFTEGTEVKQDAPLFALDKKPYEQRLNAARGMLAEAEAALNKYRTDTNRLGPLAKAKAIPQQDMDNAVASVAVGVASVQSANALVESALLDLEYCNVRAPVTGLIGAKQVSVGSLVGKGEPTLLATISTLNPIWFYCSVSEVEYLRAQRTAGRHIGETKPHLILADGSALPEPGKWVFLDRAVDATTGTIRARAEFANDSGVLRPGMFARVQIALKTQQDSILIPQRAAQELQGRAFVWLVGADGKATQRAVKLGNEIGADVLVLEGLTAGDRIVVEGIQKVREGAAVQAVTAAEAAAAAKQAETGTAPAGGKQPSKQ